MLNLKKSWLFTLLLVLIFTLATGDDEETKTPSKDASTEAGEDADEDTDDKAVVGTRTIIRKKKK